MNFMVLDTEDIEWVWKLIGKLQLIFHPRYAAEGKMEYSEIMRLHHEKDILILFDRNLFIGLRDLARYGCLKDEKEMRIIALVMTWALMNNFPIAPGLALKECGTQMKSDVAAKTELAVFQKIFDYYPSMTWLKLAEGEIDSIPACDTPKIPYEIDIDYEEEDDHFLMHLAEMLHLVTLLRNKELSAVEKMLDFLEWNYDNLIISESAIVYVAMLLTNQNGVRGPKNYNSNNLDKILDGCRNQAWDLSYVSSWSTVYYNEDKYDKIFFFATNDLGLKRILVNTFADAKAIGCIECCFSKREAERILALIEQKQTNRMRPDFGKNPRQYFYELIELEKENLLTLL